MNLKHNTLVQIVTDDEDFSHLNGKIGRIVGISKFSGYAYAGWCDSHIGPPTYYIVSTGIVDDSGYSAHVIPSNWLHIVEKINDEPI